MEDGNLVARAIPNPDTTTDNVPMITGGIWSRGKFGFTYGLVEGRIKSNPWTGNFPAFWMMPEDQSGGWPNDGEIDIWETIDSQERSWHTIHTNWTYNMKQTGSPQSSFNVATSLDRYHIFAMEWDENTITWFVDGKVVGTYYKSSDSYALNNGQWPFNDNFHLILNQSVGNNSWAANADVTHTYVTLFDWVRVYQTPGMENTNGTVGVVSVRDDAKANVYVVDGGVEVCVPAPCDVAVYDVVGRKVAEAPVNGTHRFALSCGVYVVEGTKVVVK
jgi:beta-glucanase (GH16 family)